MVVNSSLVEELVVVSAALSCQLKSATTAIGPSGINLVRLFKTYPLFFRCSTEVPPTRGLKSRQAFPEVFSSLASPARDSLRKDLGALLRDRDLRIDFYQRRRV